MNFDSFLKVNEKTFFTPNIEKTIHIEVTKTKNNTLFKSYK